MPSGIYPHKSRPLAERFWEKVDTSGGPEACWPWTGAHSSGGYGSMRIKRDGKDTTIGAHIIAYEIQIAAVPKGQHVLHKCDVPDCMNGTHFFLGTNRDNIQDRHSKGRTSHASRNQGEDHPGAKLSTEDTIEIRRLREQGIPRKEVAQRYNIHPVHVSHICSGKRRMYA